MNTLYLSLLAIQEGFQVKGWVVTISGFFIVITALVILYLVFSGLLKLINIDWKSIFKKDKKVEVEENNETDMKTSKNNVNDDVIVAIGLALSMSMEVHDEE